MIKCCSCGVEKNDDDFPWKNKSKNLKQRRCRSCYSEYNRLYYKNGEKTKQVKRVRANNKKAKEKLKELLSQYKSNFSCVVCDESAIECLDFHHMDPTQKEKAVARLMCDVYNWDRIKEEIDKCIIVCANCHRKIHSGTIKYPPITE